MRRSRKIDILNVHYLEMLAEKKKTAKGGNRKVQSCPFKDFQPMGKEPHSLYTGKEPNGTI